jgi:peptidoglycan-associated lipoprotein
VPGLEPAPVPPEMPPGDTGEMAISRGPGTLPRDHRGPGWPERPDLAGGPPGRGERPGMQPGAPEKEKGEAGQKPAAGPSRASDTLPSQTKPPTEGPRSGAAVQGKEDTVPAEQPAASSADTAKQSGPTARLQLEIAHFATDSWLIQAADSARLKADAETLKAHPDVKIVIVGNCDPRASERYNQRLGLKRAQAVRDFLVAAGVDASRISVRSDGEKRPISTKPDEFWLDRRVEFEYR